MQPTYVIGVGTVRGMRGAVSGIHANVAPFLGQLTIIPLVCASIVAPFFEISPNLPAVRAEQALLPVIGLAYIWFLLAGYVRPIRMNGMFVIGAVFSVFTTLSILYGANILGHSVILRDFYEIPKLWLPVVFYTVGYETELSEPALRRVLAFFALALVFVCVYAWGQWADLSFTHTLARYYSAGEHVEGGLRYARRVYSTMGNQNVLGQLMTWSITAFALAILFRVGNRARNAAVLLACLVTLIMTGSRYGLVTTAIALLFVFSMPTFSKQHRVAQLGAIALLSLFAVASLYFLTAANPQLKERVVSLRDPLQTESLRSRMDKFWRDAATDFAQSPFLGHGPAKTIYTGVVTDSEYLEVVRSLGLLGLLPYLGYYLLPLSFIAKGLRAESACPPISQTDSPAPHLVLWLSFIMIMTALLMNIGEGTFYNDLLQGFLWLWMGLGARAANSVFEASARCVASYAQ